MTAERRAVCDRVLGYAALVDAACTARGLDRWLVLAVIATESAGNPYAWRPEPQFLARNREGITKTVADCGVARYQRWYLRDPLVLATSFGLMQTLLVVAVERGMVLEYPTSLCEPAVGIEAGCRQLRWLFDHLPTGTPDPVRTALLRFNGGADELYPDRALAWRDDAMEAART